MNKLDQRLQAAFGRVAQFGIAHGGDFAAGGTAANAFAFIATLVTKGGTDAGTQAAGKGEAKAGTASRASVRAINVLPDPVGPISRIFDFSISTSLSTSAVAINRL